MKVYHAPDTRSVRVLWVLEELGLSYELEKYALAGAEMRSPDYLAIHPLGRVPALEDGDTLMFESGAIIQYIVAKYGDGRLDVPSTSKDYGAYLQWMHFAEGMLMPPINTIVVETVFLPPERRNGTNVSRASKLLNKMIAAVEAGLEGRDYLAGSFSAADIMSGHATMVAARFGADISDKPNIQGYIERLQARDALTRARAA